MEELMLPCLNKLLFGLDCPGCGAQRALFLLFSGDFSAAYKMYPAIYTLVGLFIFLFLNFFFKFKNSMPIKIGLIVLNAVIIIISYFFKMQIYF